MNTILYPLLGTLFTLLMTTLGSALVFFFKDEIKDFYQQLFLGFAAGIMIAASVWSLLIPSMEMAEANGQNSALILGGGFMNMIKNDEIEILEDSVENVKISNRKSSAKSNRQYFYVLFLFLLLLFALIYMCITL